MPGSGIVYAPALLPDELLYSWLARLAVFNAMGTPRSVLKQLFGCGTFVQSADLPTRLLTMAHRLGGWLPLTTLDELLECGTLLPYHRPFLTAESNSRVRHSLLHGNGEGLKTLMGRVANRFGALAALRSCPACSADNWKRYGSLYWMRRHQLPGVKCCTLHGVMLQDTPLQARIHRQRLLLPINVSDPQRDISADAQQLRFAQLSQDLVECILPAIAPVQRAATYRTAALALGYGARRGHVNFPALAEALCRRFDDFEGFEHQERLLSSAAHPLGWLSPLFNKPHRSLHPICHLLLIEFLFGSMSAFKAAYAACDVAPQSSSPSDKSVTQSAKALGFGGAAKTQALPAAHAVNHETALRDQSLSCREAAAKIGKSVTTVVTWRRAHGIPIQERRKSLHPTVIDRVLNAIGSPCSLTAVAAQTGVSLSSVYRILAQYPATARRRQDALGIAQMALRRTRWVAALLNSGKNGMGLVKAARACASADYAWLYRHDRVWLTSSMFKTESPAYKRDEDPLRVDWVQRDAELCQLLQQQIGVLREEIPPRRLTKSRLMRLLGETMVRNNLRKLPQVGVLLEKTTESTLVFGIRRVDYAIAILAKEGIPLQLWRIKRLAGLRIWPSVLTAYAYNQAERISA